MTNRLMPIIVARTRVLELVCDESAGGDEWKLSGDLYCTALKQGLFILKFNEIVSMLALLEREGKVAAGTGGMERRLQPYNRCQTSSVHSGHTPRCEILEEELNKSHTAAGESRNKERRGSHAPRARYRAKTT